MRNCCKNRQISVFAKILFIFVIVIFSFYILSIQINIKGQNDVRREITNSAKSEMNFYISSLEKEFANIISMQSRLILNADILKLSSPQLEEDNYVRFDQYKSMNGVRDKLNEMTEMSSYITEARIYIPSIDKMITNKVITDLPTAEFSRIKSLVAKNYYPFSTLDGQIYIFMTPGFFSVAKYNADISFIIRVKISGEKLEEVLGQFSENDKVGALLFENRGGLNLSVNTDNEILPYVKQYLKENHELKGGMDSIKTPFGKYFICFERSKYLDSTLLIYTPEENILAQLSRYRIWLWVMSILLVCMVTLFTLWIKGMIVKPLSKLINAFRKVDEGDFNVEVKYTSNDEFGYLYKQFNEMFSKTRILIEQVYEHKILVKNAELKQLQYQINPHFLYNSILIIQSLIKMYDNDCAMKLAQHLGNYYQYITRSSSDEVPLNKEVAHVRDYVEIQSIRFSNRIVTEFDEIPEGCHNVLVPRLIIQPIVENAYKHGLKDRIEGGILKVRMEKMQNRLSIQVEDNGEEMDDEKLESMRRFLTSNDIGVEKSGMLNVHQRLQIRYGSESGLFASKGEYGGLCVEIRIVLKEG